MRSASSFARRSSSALRAASSLARRSSSAMRSASSFARRSSSALRAASSLARRSSSALRSAASLAASSSALISAISFVFISIEPDSVVSPLGFSTTIFHSPSSISGISILVAVFTSAFPEVEIESTRIFPSTFSLVFVLINVTVESLETDSISTGIVIFFASSIITSISFSIF